MGAAAHLKELLFEALIRLLEKQEKIQDVSP